MTDQERQLVQNLLQRIRNAPPPQIDPEADDLIRRELGRRPDALYILVQSVLLQELALNEANAQIAQLRQQGSSTSFLGGAGGRGGDGGGYARSQYQQEPAPPQYVPEQPRSGFSNFLHNAAQTAAGIVAGEVAFSAISSLFGHHGGYGGSYGIGSGFLGGGGGETIVNNYFEGGDNQRPLPPGVSPDLEDRRFAGSDNFADTDMADAADVTDNDDSSDWDSADDDSSFDDSSEV